MILLGGAAPLKTKGMGALQEMPQTDMFRTFAKDSFTIERTEDILARMERAFMAALSGRPGPVFIELPFDVLFNAIDPRPTADNVTIEPVEQELSALQQMFTLLRSAQSPLIIAGTQVYWDGASDALRELTDQTGIPVFTNGAGRGTLPMTHANCFKATWLKTLREADVVLLIGTPLDSRLKYGQGWLPGGKLIQIENDVQELNHNRQADVAVVADARLVLEGLAEGLHGVRYDAWLERVAGIKKEKRDQQAEWEALQDSPANHFRFGAEVNRFIDEDTIVIGDGGDIVSACAKVIDIVRIVGNDAGWGQIRGPQITMVGEDRAIATALARAFESGKPACVNVDLDPGGMAKTSASMPYIV